MDNYVKELGVRIRDRRKALEFTQAELGKQVGVSPATIGQWEAGAIEVPITRLPPVAAALGTTVAALLGEAPAGSAKRSLDSLRLEAITLIAGADLADVSVVLAALRGKPRA